MTAAAVDTDGYPKVCCVCGERIVKSKDGALAFYFDHTARPPAVEVLSWHVRCGTPFMKGV